MMFTVPPHDLPPFDLQIRHDFSVPGQVGHPANQIAGPWTGADEGTGIGDSFFFLVATQQHHLSPFFIAPAGWSRNSVQAIKLLE